jgi:hypothetical protein
MISTIQLNDHVKTALDKMKKDKRETYEQVILNMINSLDEQKRIQEKLLIEGYKEMAEETSKITKEFENIENDNDWEWNDD